MQILLGEINQRDPYVQWILIILAVATLFYAVARPAMKKKKDPLAKPPALGSLAQQRSVERQMQNLLVELSEMARQITAQLDTRSQKLQLLIQDADERIGQLKQLQNSQIGLTAGGASSKVWPALDSPVPSRIPIPDPAPDPVDEQHRPVYSLADQGRSSSDIARELNRPRGEVELILALRGNS